MRVEILEISAPELLAMLESQNALDVCKLLIQTLAIQVEKIQLKELQKEVANELIDYCEDLVFMSDAVNSAVNGQIGEPICKLEFVEVENNSLLDQETKDSLNSWINNGGY